MHVREGKEKKQNLKVNGMKERHNIVDIDQTDDGGRPWLCERKT